jgi:hypothetical protein
MGWTGDYEQTFQNATHLEFILQKDIRYVILPATC